MTSSQYMQAITVQSPGGPEQLKISSIPIPIRKNNEILIRVLAAGINRPDIMQRKGLYPPPKDASPLLGLEVSGEVIETPENSIFKIGDKVCALTNGGGYAQYCTVPETQCLPWPTGFNAFEAAAIPETFFTVWINLFHIGKLQAGHTVLIHGGSGGIGSAAIQIANAFGATIYTTVGNNEKGNICIKLGAKEFINYKEHDFVERILNLTQTQGVDIILDIMGASYFNKNIQILKEGGKLVIISFQGGIKANDVNLASIVTKRLMISGSTLRPRSSQFKQQITQELYKHVWPLLSTRKITPLIHTIFPISEIQEAHRTMENNLHTGKILLDFSNV